MAKKYTNEDMQRDERAIEQAFGRKLAGMTAPKAIGIRGVTYCVMTDKFSRYFCIDPGFKMNITVARTLAKGLNRFIEAFDERDAAYRALPEITE